MSIEKVIVNNFLMYRGRMIMSFVMVLTFGFASWFFCFRNFNIVLLIICIGLTLWFLYMAIISLLSGNLIKKHELYEPC